MSTLSYFLMLTAYLFGSIESAILFCRLAGLPDPRENGSKNLSIANVLLIGGKLSALGVLLSDILKGLLPVAFAFYMGLKPLEIGFIGLSACLGHAFPLFLSFRGGKGVATALGVIAPVSVTVAGLALGTWLIVFVIFGYSSLSAVLVALLTPLYIWWFKPEFTFPIALICCLLVYRYHDNIQRLWRGQEPKIWRKSIKTKD